jgi:YVTN family beta-propeller protein
VAFGAGGKLMFITNTDARTVSVIDTDKDEVVQTVKVATAPEGIAFKPP